MSDDAQAHRYVILVDGAEAGYAAYRDDGSHRIFTHTKIDPDFEGQGVGSALAKAALTDVRTRGLRAVARCPFIAGYAARHQQFADVVDR